MTLAVLLETKHRLPINDGFCRLPRILFMDHRDPGTQLNLNRAVFPEPPMPSSHHHHRHHYRQRESLGEQDPRRSYPASGPSMLSMGVSLLLLAVITGIVVTALYAQTVRWNWEKLQKVADRYSPESDGLEKEETIINASLFAGGVIFVASTLLAGILLHLKFMPKESATETSHHRGRRRHKLRTAPADHPEHGVIPENCQRCQANRVSNWTFIGDDDKGRLVHLCSGCLKDLLDDHDPANK